LFVTIPLDTKPPMILLRMLLTKFGTCGQSTRHKWKIYK